MPTLLPQGKEPAIADFNWKKFNRVLDIGGAYGSMLAAVLEDNPAATGVLFELPQVNMLRHCCASRQPKMAGLFISRHVLVPCPSCDLWRK